MKPELKLLSVRMRPELIRRIKQAAFNDSMSMQDWIAEILTDKLDAEAKLDKVK